VEPWTHDRVGDARAQVFTSSPNGGGDSMLLMYLLSITAAVHTIELSACYFVPDDLTGQSIRRWQERLLDHASALLSSQL